MIDPQELRIVRVFADLADDDLRWLVDHAELRIFEPDELLFDEGDVVDSMVALLEGKILVRKEQGQDAGNVVVQRAGDISAKLPHSRMGRSQHTVRALARTRAAFVHESAFPAMLERIPQLQLRLASAMVDRSRDFTRQDEQREKLMSLGKLAAGLAHELNNPAAAIQQRAQAHARRLDALSALALRALEPTTAAALRSRARALFGSDAAGASPILDALERSDAEEALAGWLESHEVPDRWAAAETLVDAGLSIADLERLTEGLPDDAVAACLEWLSADLALRRLGADIADASQRIVELIGAVKSYSNMDRAPRSTEIDLHEGIRSALTMLSYELRRKSVLLRTDFDPGTPHVSGNPAQLNQVWTHLLDNAIDAVDEGGEITVRTSTASGQAVVEVLDDGSGIAADIQAKIFDPFFTTKEVGEGTGLGLDIVRRIVERHLGDVTVESQPGRTRFEVRLPASKPNGGAGTD
jgi:signal transduction histidine kinase